MTTTGDCNQEINFRIRKANQPFSMLTTVWRATNLSASNKINIFRSNALSVLLCRDKCWMTNVTVQRKVEVFQTKCLRRIPKIYWPNTISNEELRNRAGMDTGGNYANTAVAVVRTSLPHALHLHHQNSPQMDTSRQDKERTTKRDLAAHSGERPHYQDNESRHGLQSNSRPSQMENVCCRLTCQTAQRG